MIDKEFKIKSFLSLLARKSCEHNKSVNHENISSMVKEWERPDGDAWEQYIRQTLKEYILNQWMRKYF